MDPSIRMFNSPPPRAWARLTVLADVPLSIAQQPNSPARFAPIRKSPTVFLRGDVFLFCLGHPPPQY
jgi:hypothetical protein